MITKVKRGFSTTIFRVVAEKQLMVDGIPFGILNVLGFKIRPSDDVDKSFETFLGFLYPISPIPFTESKGTVIWIRPKVPFAVRGTDIRQ